MSTAPEPYTQRVLPDTFTDAEWELKLSFIRWREPIRLSNETARGYACRFCIARHGLKGENIAKLPQTPAEFQNHMNQYHPKP